MANEKYPIKPEWTKYYKALEVIRESGITNMFGAAPLSKRDLSGTF